MNFKYLKKVLVTPSCWVRNDNTSLKAERFYREVIGKKEQIELVAVDTCYIIFKFKERYFKTWIANKYYAFLGELWEIKPKEHRSSSWLLSEEKNYFRGPPSRSTAFEFEDLFLPKPKPIKRDDSWLTLEE